MAGYSRGNPSPRYRELTEAYRRLHVEGERFLGIGPADTFPGLSLPPQAARVKRLITSTGAANILDYGSGKGRQYERKIRAEDGCSYEGIQDYWGVDFIQCYDPGYGPYSKLPDGRFDGVVCTDVLEHCPEEDIDWILAELFAYATRFVFATVACYPARKRLPSGENAHITIQPPAWWEARFAAATAGHSELMWEVWAMIPEPGTDGRAGYTEVRIGPTP
jgi:hypothetical protein